VYVYNTYDIWTNETTLSGVIHESRKWERSNDDGVFMQHQKGPITSTFTVDWFLREGEGREMLGEWMKLTSVRSQDQRRMLQVNSHKFPSDTWIHRITKKKESNRYDLCKDLWIVEDRFKTEQDLPEQTLGHIQHTCEALSAVQIDAHNQCWRLIHGELTRLVTPKWKFCLQYLNLTQDTVWNTAKDREMKSPHTQVEVRKIQEGQPKEVVVRERFWRLHPDGIAVLPPVENEAGVFCILEHKRMSDVCDQYMKSGNTFSE
jgi:hypothetical protein